MTVREGQRVGGLIILIASLAVYGGILFHDRHPTPYSPLPWGDQGSGRIAVEVTSERGAGGIYFLPETAAVTEVSKITGNNALNTEGGLANIGLSSDSAISVSAGGGVLKIAELSVVKKLALGLPIDLNRATEEDLLLVPGIGEKMAARIVQLRQSRGRFEGLADLVSVPGIKEKKLRQIEKYLTVGK
jgi:competence ComEA-like helix-hairpin-helix protein